MKSKCVICFSFDSEPAPAHTVFYRAAFNPFLYFSLDPSYRRGRVYKLKFCVSVCLYVITSTFPFCGLQIIPESCQTPHIIYRWIWCMSGGIRSMSGGVWWRSVKSMYMNRFELKPIRHPKKSAGGYRSNLAQVRTGNLPKLQNQMTDRTKNHFHELAPSYL